MIGLGHAVTVVVGGDGVYCEELDRRAIPYRSCKTLQRSISFRRELPAIRRLREIFVQESPDLVSLHSAKAGILGRLASIGARHKVVFTAHGWSFTDGIPRRDAFIYRWVEKLVANLADRIITVSEYDRELALRYGIGQDNRIVAIHNAMPDTDEMACPGATDVVPRIVMVARLDDQKDHKTLFHALSGATDCEWRLDLVGDGPLEQPLRALSEQLGISERTNFLGLRNDVGSIMAKASIFVLASNWEGFPRSILEAMRAGLPVIASAVGGTSESVHDGVTGFVVPRGDAGALNEKLSLLMRSPELRKELGAAGKAEFEARFRFDRMARETLSVYRNVLADKANAKAD